MKLIIISTLLLTNITGFVLIFLYRYIFIFARVYVPKLTVEHVPNFTQNVPNLTGYPNVPKIEES
jgi:hypothetical protein